MTLPVNALQLSAALMITLIAAILDHRTGRIPNKLTMSALVLGLLFHAVTRGLTGFVDSACAVAVCALVPLILFKFEAMGGGDVKLFAALGAIMGLEAGMEIQSVSFFAGAIHGITVWAREKNLRSGFIAAISLITPFAGKRLRQNQQIACASKTTIRFGPAIFVGALIIAVLHIVERSAA